MATERYDVAVIGGGPGGYVAGIRLGQHGKKAVVIEREHMGGVCLNWGCIPSKAIIHAANLRNEVDHFGDVFSAVPDVDATKLQGWKNDIVKKQRSGVSSLLKANKCAELFGNATVTSPTTLTVAPSNGTGDATEVEFGQLIIATGASIIELPTFPFSEPFYRLCA